MRGGYINEEFETTVGAGELGGASEISHDQRVNGFLIGLGVEMCIMKALSARMEYSYTCYQTININDTITFPTPTSEELSTITTNTIEQFSPQASVFSLILMYTFGSAH